MAISAGGTSSAQDYYGVDKTWYSGGSWTRPLFDLNYAVVGMVIYAGVGFTGYTTFDNLEIYRQGIAANGSYASQVAYQFGNGSTGVIIQNNYIHDWATSNNVTVNTIEYSYGAIWAPAGSGVRLLNSTISDANGYFYSGGVRKNGGFGGACENCQEVSGSIFHDVMAACFSPGTCHDSEFYNVDAVNIGLYDSGIHSQVIEDDGGGNSSVYNNYIHDNPAAVTVFVCPGSPIYNNVFYNNSNQAPIIVDTNFCFAQNPATATQYIVNNTCDGTVNGSCVRLIRRGSTIGTVIMKNNIFINGNISIEATVTNYINANNYSMGTAEANTYGFTSARKYYPSSSDSHIVGQGANLTSSCSGNLTALSLDTSGARWFGGSSVARLTKWDLGAYQSGTQSTSQPNAPNNLNAVVQ